MKQDQVPGAIEDLKLEIAGLREMLRTEPGLYTAELAVAGPVMISVEIRQDCYEKARPMGKPRLFITHRDLPAVPRKGDYVDLAEGWCCERVRDVYWEANGNVVLYLEDEHDLGEEHFRLLDSGWTA